MNTTGIAHALKHLDWTGVPLGNKAVIQQAITALEHTSLQFPGDAIGYVSREVAAGSKDWERETLFDASEQTNTEPVYAAPVTAAAAIAIAWSGAYAKGLNAGLHACLKKVSEYESREWAGDTSGARACMREIELLLRALPTEQEATVSLTELAQRVIEYGTAREARDAIAVQTTFHAIMGKLASVVDLSPADVGGAAAIPEEIQRELERTDWTPEEALRWYAAGKHFDTVRGRTRILDTGAVASIALKRSDADYHAMKGADASFPAPDAAPARAIVSQAEVPPLQPIGSYPNRLDSGQRDVLELAAHQRAASRTNAAPATAVPAAEDRPIYVSVENLRLFDVGMYRMFDVGVATPNRTIRLYRAAAAEPAVVATTRNVTLWEAFEMGFALRSALLGHILDGRDVGRLTTCDFWAEPMLGMHVGTDLHVGLSVGEATVKLKTEVRRRLDALDAASNGLASTCGHAAVLRGWTIQPYSSGWAIAEPDGRTHIAHDAPTSDETERVLARVCAVLAAPSTEQTNTTGLNREA